MTYPAGHLFERAPSYGCYASGCRCKGPGSCTEAKRIYGREWQRKYRAIPGVREKERERERRRVFSEDERERRRVRERERRALVKAEGRKK